MSSSADDTFMRFHQKAQARKMDLAMRGLDCPNVLIDELYERAEAGGVAEATWPRFLLEQIPSPRGEEEPEPRTLQRIAQCFLDSLLGGSDVHVQRFVFACKNFAGVIAELGPFAAVSVREANVNLGKIEDAQRAAAAQGAPANSLEALLKHESASGMHGAGGVLQDPSAAMGILWVARLLAFWEEVVVLRTVPPPADAPADAEFRETIMAAYKSTLLPYHGWVTEKAFVLAVQAAPAWSDVERHFAPTLDDFKSDVHEWVRISQQIQDRITAVLRALDLEDTRKSM